MKLHDLQEARYYQHPIIRWIDETVRELYSSWTSDSQYLRNDVRSFDFDPREAKAVKQTLIQQFKQPHLQGEDWAYWDFDRFNKSWRVHFLDSEAIPFSPEAHVTVEITE